MQTFRCEAVCLLPMLTFNLITRILGYVYKQGPRMDPSWIILQRSEIPQQDVNISWSYLSTSRISCLEKHIASLTIFHQLLSWLRSPTRTTAASIIFFPRSQRVYGRGADSHRAISICFLINNPPCSLWKSTRSLNNTSVLIWVQNQRLFQPSGRKYSVLLCTHTID